MNTSFKKHPLYIFGCFTWTVYKVLQILLSFGRILAIENLQKHLILALLIFNMTFWLFNTQREKQNKAGRQTSLFEARRALLPREHPHGDALHVYRGTLRRWTQGHTYPRVFKDLFL